jgi:hypothetical protein
VTSFWFLLESLNVGIQIQSFTYVDRKQTINGDTQIKKDDKGLIRKDDKKLIRG